MSENLSTELPVITNIDDLPKSVIEEFSNGEGTSVVKPAVTTTSKSEQSNTSTVKKSAVVEDENTDAVKAEVVKPKRKRRTKAEIEAAKAVEVEVKQ